MPIKCCKLNALHYITFANIFGIQIVKSSCEFRLTLFLNSVQWPQQTRSDYFIEIGFTLVFGEVSMCFNGTLMVFFISMCLHHDAFNKMLQHFLRKLGTPNSNHKNEKILCNLVRFHNLTKT